MCVARLCFHLSLCSRNMGRPTNPEGLKEGDKRLRGAKQCMKEGCTNLIRRRSTTGVCQSCYVPPPRASRKTVPVEEPVLLLSGFSGNNLGTRGHTWVIPGDKAKEVARGGGATALLKPAKPARCLSSWRNIALFDCCAKGIGASIRTQLCMALRRVGSREGVHTWGFKTISGMEPSSIQVVTGTSGYSSGGRLSNRTVYMPRCWL